MSAYRSTHQAVGSVIVPPPAGQPAGLGPATGGIPFLRLCRVELR